MLERAHVVQAVGQLDEHHAHVGDHGQQHLADVFGLAVFAVGELDLVDLGDALDDVSHLVAEVGLDLLAGGRRVFDGVMQETGGDGRRVHLHFGQNFSHFKRMDDVRLARGAHLALVVLHAEFPRLADERNVFGGAIGLNVAEKRLRNGDRWKIGRGPALERAGRSLPEPPEERRHREALPVWAGGLSPYFIIGTKC